MGKGLALQFRLRYPDMFADYVARCRAGRVRVGQPYLYRDGPEQPWILNFPTKDDWRQRSRLEYLRKGLEYFSAHYREMGIVSIAFPQLGCQNGGLDWRQVRPLMERYLKPLDIDVVIYLREAEPSQARATTQSDALLDLINTAESAADLRSRLDIRNSQAAAILQHRGQRGRFARLGDLLNVKGIGKATYMHIVALGSSSRQLQTAEVTQGQMELGWHDQPETTKRAT